MVGNTWVAGLDTPGGFQSAPDVAAGGGPNGFWASVTVMPIAPVVSGDGSIFGTFDESTQTGYEFFYGPGNGVDIFTANVGLGGSGYALSATLTSVRSQALCLMLFVDTGADPLAQFYINGVLVSTGALTGGSYTPTPGAPLLVQEAGDTGFLAYLGAGFYDQDAFPGAGQAYHMVQQTGVYDVPFIFSNFVSREDLSDNAFWTNAWNVRNLYTGGLQADPPRKGVSPDTWLATHGDEDLTKINQGDPGFFQSTQHTQWYQPSLGQAPTAPALIPAP